MFKTTKVEKKKRKKKERNKLYYLSSNKSLFMQSFKTIIYHCLLSDCHANSLGTRNVLHKIFERYTNHGARKDAVEITFCNPPEIVQKIETICLNVILADLGYVFVYLFRD